VKLQQNKSPSGIGRTSVTESMMARMVERLAPEIGDTLRTVFPLEALAEHTFPSLSGTADMQLPSHAKSICRPAT
jgi:hypothetical protein